MTSLQRNVLRAAVFLSGAMLMAAEISAFRIVGKTFGSALRETTAVIAVFLTAMSIGYWAGGRAGDRWPRPTTIVAALLGASASLFWIPWLDVLMSPRIASSDINIGMHALLATCVLFAIPTALFASVSPIAVRLFATSTGESGSTAGSISAISTVGSIAGSLLTAFFLLDWLASITRTLIFVALFAAATAAMLLLASASRRWVLVTAAIVILAIPTVAWMQSASIDQSLTQDSFGWRSVFVGDSAYHRIVVRQHGNAVRHLYFGDTRQSMMYLSDPHGEGMTYTSSFHLARLMRPSLKRVLLIGLGGGTAAKQFAHHYDDTIVDAVEVDPMVVDVAKRFFALQPNDRMRVHVVDGRLFLKRTTETWDLIVVDAYTTNRYGSTIPPHLTTREFLGDVASHLAPGGVLHFHCAYGATKLRPAMQKTIASVFASTLVSEGEIIASDVALITPKDVLTERLKSSRTARLSALPTYIRELAPAPPPRADVPVLTDDYAPVDTLMREKI